MSEARDPLIETLGRFTPAPALDRDAVIFAAGRRAARPSRVWVAAASLLAVSQVLSLVLLWPRDSAFVGVRPEADTSAIELLPPESPASSELMWSIRSSPEVVANTPPGTDGDFASPGPTLTAGSIRRIELASGTP